MNKLPHSVKIIIAFAAIYLIWGSTFLGIKYAIESIPPFLMAGLRHTAAGIFLYTIVSLTNKERPKPIHWRDAAIIGGLLLVGGNGGVSWAEKYVPSGLAALMVATVSLWMVVLNWFIGDRHKPQAREIISIILGLLGLAILIGPEEIIGAGKIDTIGALILLGASLLWAIGSLYSRKANLPSSPMLSIAMEMLAGGSLLLVFAIFTGDWNQIRWDAVSERSWIALAYLGIFGSLIGFTAYIWLLRQTSPAKVSTYAYVNPLVAVLLGAAYGGEAITTRTLISAAVIIGAVMIITLKKSPPPASALEEPAEIV